MISCHHLTGTRHTPVSQKGPLNWALHRSGGTRWILIDVGYRTWREAEFLDKRGLHLTFGIPGNERFSVTPLILLHVRLHKKGKYDTKRLTAARNKCKVQPFSEVFYLSCWEAVMKANDRHKARRTQYLSQTLMWRDRRQDLGASCLWRGTSHMRDLPCPASGGCDRHAGDS